MILQLARQLWGLPPLQQTPAGVLACVADQLWGVASSPSHCQAGICWLLAALQHHLQAVSNMLQHLYRYDIS